MATLAKIVVKWTGWAGAPGYSVHWADASGTLPLSDLRTFYNAALAYTPAGVTLTFPGSGDTIDEVTGSLNGTWAQSAPAAVTGGAGATQFPAPAGACVTWVTSRIINRRRLRGRTFIVPMYVGAYQLDGTLEASVMSALNSAAATLVTNAGSSLRIYHRPKGASSGQGAAIVGHSITDQVAVLKTRRA